MLINSKRFLAMGLIIAFTAVVAPEQAYGGSSATIDSIVQAQRVPVTSVTSTPQAVRVPPMWTPCMNRRRRTRRISFRRPSETRVRPGAPASPAAAVTRTTTVAAPGMQNGTFNASFAGLPAGVSAASEVNVVNGVVSVNLVFDGAVGDAFTFSLTIYDNDGYVIAELNDVTVQ